MGPTIRSASLVDYVEVARSVGLDPYKMLARVRLPRSCLRNPDLRISADAVAELLEASATAARVEDFALRLAKRRGLSNLGPLALIVREQPTLATRATSQAPRNARPNAAGRRAFVRSRACYERRNPR